MEKRYDFGRNWADYSQQLDKESIDYACEGFRKLINDIKGKSFMDIGSGSGVHSVAASMGGADEVYCVDYDINSVETTERMLKKYAENKNWHVTQGDILSDSLIIDKKFDIVYSWGVLHHTGDVWKAISNALNYVNTDGYIILALYLKTPLCQMWKYEKYIYSHYKYLRPVIRYPYTFLLLLALCLRKAKFPSSIINNYSKVRGMSFYHDVDDWLGGYPYESVKSKELILFMQERNYKLINKFNTKSPIGLFGTGCGEWVFQKC